MEEFFVELFKAIDQKLSELEESSDETGATACMVFITEEEGIIQTMSSNSIGKRVLYSANIGDSRAIWITDEAVTRLSYDHKASDESEQKRIQ